MPTRWTSAAGVQFAIRGFGEASQAYFGKDIRQLTLAEAATLAGLIQQTQRTQSGALAGAGQGAPQRRAESDAGQRLHHAVARGASGGRSRMVDCAAGHSSPPTRRTSSTW